MATALRLLAQLNLREGDAQTALGRLLTAFRLSVPIADRLGEGAVLEGLVLAAHAAEESELAARAAGVLEAYRQLSGVVPAPWQPDRLNLAQAELDKWDSPAYRRAFRAGLEGGLRGLPQLAKAMEVDIDPALSRAAVEALIRWRPVRDCRPSMSRCHDHCAPNFWIFARGHHPDFSISAGHRHVTDRAEDSNAASQY